jgi:hypothetical protein
MTPSSVKACLLVADALRIGVVCTGCASRAHAEVNPLG